jgi:hypothetical protein
VAEDVEKQERNMSSIFSKTEKEKGEDVDLGHLDDGNIRSTGVGLREGEIRALDHLGKEIGEYLDTEPLARNALMRIAIRDFLEKFFKGEVTVEEIVQEKVDRPKKPKPGLNF